MTLAANEGGKDSLFKRYGRRKLENVKHRYIEDNLELLLVISL